MREMDFKVEQQGVVEAGQKVKVIESRLPGSYYYTIEHALGMSANYVVSERLKTFEGVIKSVEETPRGLYATLEFDE